MTLKYSRIPSLMFTIVSLAIGVPLITALVSNGIEPKLEWLAWGFVILAALVLVQGIKLLVAPPTVLEIVPDGIRLYYKFGRIFSKDADLLPWRIVDKIRLVRSDGRDKSFNWSIELTLGELPAFDMSKRNAKSTILQSDPYLFYIDTFVLSMSRGELLTVFESGWRQWQARSKDRQHN